MNRPVILLGNGIRNNPALIEYLCGLGIPILTTWMAIDLLPENHPSFCGRPGVLGQRAANIIQQKATHLYCLGARLDEQQVAYRYDNFAPKAEKFVWEVDRAEQEKLPEEWFRMGTSPVIVPSGDINWLSWCKSLYTRLRPELDGVDNPNYVDPFKFVYLLSDYAQADDIIVSGAGKAGEILCQAFKVKQGQRFITLSTNGAMGNDIPLSIGAAIASGRRVLCVTGDGGFQLNTQELEVVRRLKLNIQFFVHSNRGYGSIRQMQLARFGNVVGADPESGFTMPTLAEIADCYGLRYQRIETLTCPNDADYIPEFDGQIIELMIDPDYVHYPRVATALVDGKWVQDSMEDMTPRLAELEGLMNE